MRTNEYDDSHGNSANTIPTTNHYHHRTQKNTAVHLITIHFKIEDE